MGWSLGFDSEHNRDVGYGVPAFCDHPGCTEKIDRGIAYICGAEIGGGEHGCGLFFCQIHQVGYNQTCACCAPRRKKKPFDPTPDHPDWIHHKLTDESWQQWRDDNPDTVALLAGERIEKGI